MTHMCIKPLSLISNDSRTPRNSRTNFNVEGENVTGYSYIVHLYCLAVQAGFYSDVVVLDFCAEGRGFDPRPGQV